MPDREHRTETLRAGTPFTVGPVTLLPIERVVLRSVRRDGRVWLVASKEPRAIVVRDPGGTRAFETGAGAVSLEELRDRIPELDDLLV